MLKYDRFVNEILGADQRCTNVTLESFGICSDQPFMRWSDTRRALEERFEDKYLSYYQLQPSINMEYLPDGVDYEMLDGKLRDDTEVLVPKYNSVPHPELDGVFTKRTVNQFVRTISRRNAFGHFVLGVRAHVLGVHHLRDGAIYVIDNEEKFVSRRMITDIIGVADPSLAGIFNNYLDDVERWDKIERIK